MCCFCVKAFFTHALQRRIYVAIKSFQYAKILNDLPRAPHFFRSFLSSSETSMRKESKVKSHLHFSLLTPLRLATLVATPGEM